MDKYEYKVRADEIKELIAKEEYVQAAEIADTIDWRRVKSVMMLCTISDLYKINRRYEDARDMLLLAYERRPGGRTICYSLCELSIKMEEYVQAVEYYKEFVQVAPKDSGRYILQYKLYEAQDVSLEERIEVLEELKKRDYREKWAYELAYLYHRVGLATRCVEECDEMILWFGDGKYVVKALELKKLHEPLTPAQQEKYDNRFRTVEQQAVLQNDRSSEENVASEEANAQTLGDTRIYAPVQPQPIQQGTKDDMEIHVKTMDVGEYNTINLQAELAAGLKEVLEEETIQNPITRSIVAPMMESDTETLDYPQIDEVSEDDLEPEIEEIENSEVFFGETGEIIPSPQDGQISAEGCSVEEDLTELVADEEAKAEAVTEEGAVSAAGQAVTDVTAEIVMEQMRREEADEGKASLWNTEPPKELAGVLSQESDGQLSLVMPEKENIEKQITGQMSIEDILAEWERMKKENEEKRKEEVRRHVLRQTGTMFTEFEAAVRDGLLEQLENGRIEDSDDEEEPMKEASETAEETTEEKSAEEPEKEASETAEETTEEESAEEPEEELMKEASETAEETTEEESAEESEEEPEEEPVKEASETAEETTEEKSAEEREEEPEEEPMKEASETAEETTEEESAEVAEEASQQETESETMAVKPEVVRDKAKVRALTREERELYAPYVQSRRAREQLVQAVDSISLAAYTGNIIITGEEGMDTMTLAKNMIREVQMEDSNFSGKVAKISANALNKKEVASILRDLKNGALIIQKASELDAKTADALNRALQQENVGIIVVLLDTGKEMNRFLSENEALHSCFTARMDVEALSNDTLVAFGRQYAKEKEYFIDELGVLALHTRIETMQTSDHIVTVLEVKEIVDGAIRHANRKTIGHFFDILFAKRYDEEDMIILGEKDFV